MLTAVSSEADKTGGEEDEEGQNGSGRIEETAESEWHLASSIASGKSCCEESLDGGGGDAPGGVLTASGNVLICLWPLRR